MNRVAMLGCLPCKQDGHFNDYGSIHHVDGRTKPGAHFKVLFLCAGHHQPGTGPNPHMLSVHGNKARFEAKYGTQAELLAETERLLADS